MHFGIDPYGDLVYQHIDNQQYVYLVHDFHRPRKNPDQTVRVSAEKEGFEPPVPVRAHLISSQAHSTTLALLRAREDREQNGTGHPDVLPNNLHH